MWYADAEMRSILAPRLVNDRFGDPVLYVRVAGERGAMLFDLGELGALRPSELLRVGHVFLSHTHIDHFIGFDYLLRLVLGRNVRIVVHGPPGLIRQVRGKLAGYTWNLVEDYRLELEAAEWNGRRLRRRLFTCRDRFRHEEAIEPVGVPDGLLADAPLWSVRACLLDHFTPCLAYALTERMHVAIHPDRLERDGLAAGPWISRLKRLYASGRGAERIEAAGVDGQPVSGRVDDLVSDLATVQRGRKIVYATDIAPTEANIRHLADFAAGADILYCEATFLDADRERAATKGHLTAALAGEVAALAGVGRLEVFHFSPRYTDAGLLRGEAERTFKGA